MLSLLGEGQERAAAAPVPVVRDADVPAVEEDPRLRRRDVHLDAPLDDEGEVGRPRGDGLGRGGRRGGDGGRDGRGRGPVVGSRRRGERAGRQGRL
ncbi:hypothetical protein FBQ97_13270, partial [Acidobacteria bacterium ACD]|nr:hypothetical protein [Acidobacteria bacterium ACD]